VIRRRGLLFAAAAALALPACGRKQRLAAIAPGATVLALGG
jgi:hypothetical protein